MLSDTVLYIGHHQIAKTIFSVKNSILSFLLCCKSFLFARAPTFTGGVQHLL